VGPTLIADTGPLYAATDRDDAAHHACLDLLGGFEGAVLVPHLVIAEAAYLIGSRLGPDTEARWLGLFADGTLLAVGPDAADWARIAELAATYDDLPLGATDASVIATAERVGATTIATLDRAHFGIVRPRHIDAFHLVP
jgi:hypothetical protein